jgi:hypothetical protein
LKTGDGTSVVIELMGVKIAETPSESSERFQNPPLV